MNEIKLQIKGREQDTYTVHYSCDGFYDGGAYAPAICSIALVNYATKEYIRIDLGREMINLPKFDSGSMYKGMKLNKGYTLEELGL